MTTFACCRHVYQILLSNKALSDSRAMSLALEIFLTILFSLISFIHIFDPSSNSTYLSKILINRLLIKILYCYKVSDILEIAEILALFSE